jgi:hypothetical protein
LHLHSTLPYPLLLHFSPFPFMVSFLSLLRTFVLCHEPLTMPHHDFFFNITFSFYLQQCNNLLLHVYYNIFPLAFFCVARHFFFIWFL